MTTRERVATNISRLLEGREREVGQALYPGMSPAHGAGNVRRFARGERFPSPATLDLLAATLGVDVSAFFQRP